MTKKKKARHNYQMLTNSCFIEIEGVDTEDIMEIVKKRGSHVSEQEAEKMLEFLKLLTRMTIKEFFSPE